MAGHTIAYSCLRIGFVLATEKSQSFT